MESIIIIGYSGHSYVVIDILMQQGYTVIGYLDKSLKFINPFSLPYIGDENLLESINLVSKNKFIVTIGDNRIRENVFGKMVSKKLRSINAIHPKSTIGHAVKLREGIMIMADSVLNAFCEIGDSVIINTGAIIEHECIVGNFSHVASGAVLAGNVEIGHRTFIGANSVVKEGIKIGNDVIVGAGSVVIRDIPDGSKVVGNPAKRI